jgi:Uncharacterized conserved protein
MYIATFFIALALLLVLWVISTYNRMVKLRNLKEEGWSGIDVQLKRRHDLVGNLVNTVKGYMAHERAVLEEVTSKRAESQKASGIAASGAAEAGLSGALGRLFAVMENYPDLKANATVLELQNSLNLLEHELQMARRYYNGTVRDLNTLIQTFPVNLVARQFAFTQGEFFELDNAAERQAPTVNF